MIGRLGKAAAEIALQFMSEGMNLDDAVRAGAKLMDEKLSPAAEMMLKQNARQQEKVHPMYSDDFEMSGPGYISPETYRSESRNIMLSNLYGSIPDRRRFTQQYNKDTGMNAWLSNGYVVKQLLLDAAEGDEALAALLARRLGFSNVMSKPVSPAAMSYLGRMP